MENKYLRTIGSIKENALKYQAAASKHKGKKKLTSAPFFSCEQVPLCGSNIDDSTLVIDLLPPMELHIMLGITNDIYDFLKQQLDGNECSTATRAWSDSLGLDRSSYNGGQFNGNQC